MTHVGEILCDPDLVVMIFSSAGLFSRFEEVPFLFLEMTQEEI